MLFLKKLSSYNLYIVHASQKRGNCHSNLIFSFLIMYIVVSLHWRKFCDGHIILITCWFENGLHLIGKIYSRFRIWLFCFKFFGQSMIIYEENRVWRTRQNLPMPATYPHYVILTWKRQKRKIRSFMSSVFPWEHFETTEWLFFSSVFMKTR